LLFLQRIVPLKNISNLVFFFTKTANMTNDFKTLFEEKCAECDQLKSEIEILKQDKESLESMVDELQELCDECSAETDRLTVSNEDLESKTFELEEELERLKTTHGQQSSSYIEQIQCLNKDMIELKRTQVQLETQVEKLLRNERLLTNRADKAEKNLYDKAEEVVMLKSQLEDDREEYEKKILRLNREMKDSEDNNRVLMMQLEKLSNVNNSIRDDPNLIPSDTRREDISIEGSSQNIPTKSHFACFETALSDVLIAGEVERSRSGAIRIQCSQSEI